MIEIVNPSHPDKIADRIAGAIVDFCYCVEQKHRPTVAVEVLIGHEQFSCIVETNVGLLDKGVIIAIASRIAGVNDRWGLYIKIVRQDPYLAENQAGAIRCGDNGIFRGTLGWDDEEEKDLAVLARKIYQQYPTDGKYILSGDKLIVCQSYAASDILNEFVRDSYPSVDTVIINPLGYWTGGLDVDSGATNRKLGSDMGRAVTGGGLHGKDLSKADVSVNIYAHLHGPCQIHCAIGDESICVDTDTTSYQVPYELIVDEAKKYIERIGGFEKFAEWGFHSEADKAYLGF